MIRRALSVVAVVALLAWAVACCWMVARLADRGDVSACYVVRSVLVCTSPMHAGLPPVVAAIA